MKVTNYFPEVPQYVLDMCEGTPLKAVLATWDNQPNETLVIIPLSAEQQKEYDKQLKKLV